LLSETARQIACQLAPQKRPNNFKNTARILVLPPIPFDLRFKLTPQS